MAYRKKSGACCRVPNSADIEVNEVCNNPPYLDLGGRGQQRGQTIVFLEGVLQRTKQLAEVLEWLTATRRFCTQTSGSSTKPLLFDHWP